MMDGNKIKATIRELLEVGGLLKTGEFDIAYEDATKDAEWIKVHIQVRPKRTTWNAALDQLPPQHPLMMRLLEWMSASEKIELYRLFYVMIKRWTEDDSALPDDQREKLTAICEDMLEALAKAPDQPGQLQPAKFIKCNTCNELVPAKFIEYLADDDDTAICLVCLQRARAVHKKQESEEQPTPIVMLDKKIEELRLDIEERKRVNGRPENFLTGRQEGLEEARRLFMHYWKTTGSSIIYEHAAQCSTCGRVAPAHLLKPAADTGKSICMACIDEKRQALKSCHPVGKPPGCEKGFCFDCEDEMADHLLGRDLKHRVQQAMGRISSDNWDDMINTINNMRARSGARGKQLFELKRAIMQIKQKLKKEVDRYQEDEGRALDAEERDEHDQHGAFIRGIRAALVFLDAVKDSKSQHRTCVICGKELLITPPKGPEELPVPGRVVCETCTKKATDPGFMQHGRWHESVPGWNELEEAVRRKREVDLEAGFGIITHEGKRVDVRPLLASICNSILEIVEDFSDTDERSTSLVKHLTKLQERAERAGLVLATKL